MKKRKSFYSLLFALIATTFILAGCTSKYSIAQSLQAREKYAAAIETYDNFIRISSNGAKSTEAELERSECYYQLGMKAFESDK